MATNYDDCNYDLGVNVKYVLSKTKERSIQS